mgnify:FL=1
MSKSYKVNKISKRQLTISGKGDSIAWRQANVIEDFCSPWSSRAVNKIEFKALHDSEKLFFSFKVYDSQVHINPSEHIYNSINNSDRVELFFRSDSKMNPYYCLEIDPRARVMDFFAKPNKNFDFNWNWPSEHIEVKSSISKHFFVVEGAISLQSLFNFNLLKNEKLEIGVYRAKYSKQNNGEYNPIWITWVNPETETPNFHIPSSFGIFKFQ